MGITTCFIPVFTDFPRVLLMLCFGHGGFLLFLQMCLDRDKLRIWVEQGGIFRHLILACGMVYAFSMAIGLLLWKRSLLTTPMTAVAVLLFGMAIFYLAGVLWKIYRVYPAAERRPDGDAELTTDRAMLLLMGGVFLMLLGMLLIPVNLGLLPFSESAQIGLLMVIFAVQMLASGSTPIGPFHRSWPIVGLGFLFAALGIVSTVIPGTVAPPIWNKAGGAPESAKTPDESARAILKGLAANERIVIVTDADRDGSVNAFRPDAAKGVDDYLLSVARQRKSGKMVV